MVMFFQGTYNELAEIPQRDVTVLLLKRAEGASVRPNPVAQTDVDIGGNMQVEDEVTTKSTNRVHRVAHHRTFHTFTELERYRRLSERAGE